MIYIGIDVAKDKHDCHFVSHPDDEVLCDNLQISNSLEGFNQLFNTILEYSNNDLSQVKVGLVVSSKEKSIRAINLASHLSVLVFLSVRDLRNRLTLKGLSSTTLTRCRFK